MGQLAAATRKAWGYMSAHACEVIFLPAGVLCIPETHMCLGFPDCRV